MGVDLVRIDLMGAPLNNGIFRCARMAGLATWLSVTFFAITVQPRLSEPQATIKVQVKVAIPDD